LAPELSPHEIEKLVREAEDHAAEDREQERKIAIRNRLDSSVAAAERTLREYRDTIPDELHREVQAAIEETTRLISEGNLDNADAAIQKLDSLFYRLSSSLSISPQPAAQPAASPVSAAAPAAESAETATFAESEAGSEKVRYSSRE
jgi:molecular chaperone DnaK